MNPLSSLAAALLMSALVAGDLVAGDSSTLKFAARGEKFEGRLTAKILGEGGKLSSLYATAATDAATGDIMVKVGNAAAAPLPTELDLSGAANLSGTATGLTPDRPKDENSLAEPTRVSPKTENLSYPGTTRMRAFPGNSFTVLRLKTK
jgi:alpha-L-arabinofuranosidase